MRVQEQISLWPRSTDSTRFDFEHLSKHAWRRLGKSYAAIDRPGQGTTGCMSIECGRSEVWVWPAVHAGEVLCISDYRRSRRRLGGLRLQMAGWGVLGVGIWVILPTYTYSSQVSQPQQKSIITKN
jgi:hypothetical protein